MIIRLLIALLLLPQLSWAAVHYVSTGGTDTWANSTSIETPCSYSTMLANVAAGDTVYLRGGNYSTRFILPAGTNGTSGSPITVEAYTPSGGTREVVNFTNASEQINVDSKDYIVFRGLVFQNPSLTSDSRWIDGDYSEHVTVEDCNFADASYSAHMLWRYSKYLILRNCTVGSASSAATRDATVDHMTFTGAEYPLIEGCTFRQTQHYCYNGLANAKYAVIRNCTFENTWHAGVSFLSVYPNLIEGCTFRNQGESHTTNPELRARTVQSRDEQFAFQASENSLHAAIIRRNVFYNNGASYNQAPHNGYTTGRNYFYHNVSDQEYQAVRFGSVTLTSPSTTVFAGNVFKNNIFNRGRNYGIYCAPPTTIYSSCVHNWTNNNFYNPGKTNKYKAANAADSTVLDSSETGLNGTYPTEFVGNISSIPGFTNADMRDYNLTSASAMIDAGAFLTTVTAKSSSAPWTITVADAKYFTNGFGIVDGDTIQFEDGATTYTISAVNYTTNVITINADPGSVVGKGVALEYSGTAPDIGAIEYASGSLPYCGDGTCNGDETHASCAADCEEAENPAWAIQTVSQPVWASVLNGTGVDLLGATNLTETGTVGTAADHVASADKASINSGSNANYFSAADGATWDITGALSAHKKVMIHGALTNGDDYLISKWSAAGGKSYALGWTTTNAASLTGRWWFKISSDGSTEIIAQSASTTLVADTWYYVTGVFTPGSHLKVWVNGTAVATTTTTAMTVYNSSSEFRLFVHQDAPANDDYSDITLWVTGESATITGSGGYSAGDTSMAAVNEAAINTDANKTGTNGIDIPTAQDYYQFGTDVNLMIDDVAGSGAVWWRNNAANLTDNAIIWRAAVSGGAMFVRASGTDEIEFCVNDGSDKCVATDAANVASAMWYFLVWRESETNGDVHIAVYNADGTLRDSAENTSSTFNMPQPTSLFIGNTSVYSSDFSIDQIFAVSSRYDRNWVALMNETAVPEASTGVMGSWRMTDVALWNVALSEAEILKMDSLGTDFDPGAEAPTATLILSYSGTDPVAVATGGTVTFAWAYDYTGTYGDLTCTLYPYGIAGASVSVDCSPDSGTTKNNTADYEYETIGLHSPTFRITDGVTTIDSVMTNRVRVKCLGGADWYICSSGTCCDDSGATLTFEPVTGMQSGARIHWLGNTDIDLADSNITTLSVVGAGGYGTATGNGADADMRELDPGGPIVLGGAWGTVDVNWNFVAP